MQHEWRVVREQAIRLFNNETPYDATEQEIVEAFKARPTVVISEIEKIGQQMARGSDIRSGWAVLRRSVASAISAGPSVTATDDFDRERAVEKAIQWINTAGCHFDRESELVDELFGSQGRLQPYCPFDRDKAIDASGTETLDWTLGFDASVDMQLVEVMVAHWRTQKRRGERVEREAEERAARRIAQRERLRELARKPVPSEPS